MSTLLLKVVTARPVSYLDSNFETITGKHAIAQRISDFIERILSGNELGSSVTPSINISIQDNKVAAFGSVTFSAPTQSGDTFIINGITFTCATSPTGNQWAPGSTATQCAGNLAAAINGSATTLISGCVKGSNSQTGNVCVITSVFFGFAGNQATIAKGTDTGSVMVVSGARLTGGLEDSGAQTISF